MRGDSARRDDDAMHGYTSSTRRGYLSEHLFYRREIRRLLDAPRSKPFADSTTRTRRNEIHFFFLPNFAKLSLVHEAVRDAAGNERFARDETKKLTVTTDARETERNGEKEKEKETDSFSLVAYE